MAVSAAVQPLRAGTDETLGTFCLEDRFRVQNLLRPRCFLHPFFMNLMDLNAMVCDA